MALPSEVCYSQLLTARLLAALQPSCRAGSVSCSLGPAAAAATRGRALSPRLTGPDPSSLRLPALPPPRSRRCAGEQLCPPLRPRPRQQLLPLGTAFDLARL